MLYDDFKAAVEQYCSGWSPNGRLVPIPALRRALAARVDGEHFDVLLCALQHDGHVHLLSHVDLHSLPDDERRDCVSHPSGLVAYWVCWV